MRIPQPSLASCTALLLTHDTVVVLTKHLRVETLLTFSWPLHSCKREHVKEEECGAAALPFIVFIATSTSPSPCLLSKRAEPVCPVFMEFSHFKTMIKTALYLEQILSW